MPLHWCKVQTTERIAHATQAANAARHNYQKRKIKQNMYRKRNENKNINELFGKTNATGAGSGSGS